MHRYIVAFILSCLHYDSTPMLKRWRRKVIRTAGLISHECVYSCLHVLALGVLSFNLFASNCLV